MSMKALPKKLLPLTLFGIAVTSLFSVQPAQAFTMTLKQVGLNVVANGSGAFNLTGLTFFGRGVESTKLQASRAQIITGAVFDADFYTGRTGPTSFGSGGIFFADASIGEILGLSQDRVGNRFLLVPAGYVSGTALSSGSTWTNATFASLGVTPGTYVWSWGDGANQRFTLRIGGAGVPDSGSTVCLLGCALLGLAAFRLKFS